MFVFRILATNFRINGLINSDFANRIDNLFSNQTMALPLKKLAAGVK